MTNRSPSGLEQSIKQRLLNVSRAGGETFNIVLVRFAIERFLHRLTQTPHADTFVLKGAVLFSLWADEPHRPTQDLDLLGSGEPSAERLRAIFHDVCRVTVEPDGLTFDADSIVVRPIRQDALHDGQRAKLRSTLGSARIDLQIDVGFGDAITPPARQMTLPSILGLSSPSMRAYPPETVVAEKLDAIVTLAMSNTRMKDYFDVWTLSRTMEFDETELRTAIAATFRRRGTGPIEVPPPGLSREFAGDPSKRAQWSAFIRRLGRDVVEPELTELVDRIGEFLLPLLPPERGDRPCRTWRPGGPWS